MSCLIIFFLKMIPCYERLQTFADLSFSTCTGILGLCDYLFGTDVEYKKHIQQQKEKAAKIKKLE